MPLPPCGVTLPPAGGGRMSTPAPTGASGGGHSNPNINNSKKTHASTKAHSLGIVIGIVGGGVLLAIFGVVVYRFFSRRSIGKRGSYPV